MFFNPASGKIENESKVFTFYNGLWINSTGSGFSSFDDLWAETNLAIKNNMVTVEHVDVVLPDDIVTGGGGEGTFGTLLFR